MLTEHQATTPLLVAGVSCRGDLTVETKQINREASLAS